MADRETLTSEVSALSAAIGGAASAERERAGGVAGGGAGRLDSLASSGSRWAEKWVLGGDLDLRYPSGPAFQPLPYRPTLWGLTTSLRASDAAYTAAGAAVAYAMGHAAGEGEESSRAAFPQQPRAAPVSTPAPLRPPSSAAAPTLGLARLPGNRLGVALTLPMLFIGYTAGLKRAFARHLGYAENGQPPLYPGYVADSTVPQWVRHEVSDRRR
jgi:hypothetical protein